jgi:hypothetical protein
MRIRNTGFSKRSNKLADDSKKTIKHIQKVTVDIY